MPNKTCEFMGGKSEVWDKLTHGEMAYSILEKFHEGLAIIDLDYNILMLNRWMENLYGKDLVGKKCYSAFYGRSSVCPQCPIREVAEKKSSRHIILPPGEDRKKWFEAFFYPLTDEDGNVVAVIEHLRDITDRKTLEEKLKEEKKRFEDIASHIGEWVWEVDREGRYTYSSSVVEKILGYKPEEVIGRFFYEFFLPEERETLKRRAFEIFSKKRPFHKFLNKLLRKDGKVVIVETDGVPVLSDDGELLGYRGADHDVTERMETERKLRESEERFKSITNDVMNAVEVGFLLLDRNHRIAWVNSTFEKYFGIKREELIGKGKEEVVKERIKFIFENPDEFERRVLSSKDKSPHVDAFECHVLPGENREERWLEYRCQPIETGFYAGGCVELYYDVSERKRLECKLRESIEIFRSIAEYAKDAIIMIDDDGSVIFWNKMAEKMFGYRAEEVIGKDVHLLCAPEKYHRDYIEGFKTFKSSGKGKIVGKTVEMTALRKNGEEFPVELSVGAFKIKARWHAVAVVRDISERKRMEKEIEEKLKELEKFYKIAIDRELRMIELKREINELCRKYGEKPRYESTEEEIDSEGVLQGVS